MNEPALICLCYSGFVACVFLICVFLLLFQTPENIFRKNFWNATKHHGNIFLFRKLAFLENMYFSENDLQQPNTALVVFRKCCFSKIFTKIQNFSILLFGNSLASREFSKPSHKVTQKRSQLYGKWDFQSWKTLRKFFKNLGFSFFGDSFSWLLHKWKSKSRVHLEAFANHWQVEIPVMKKT